MIEPFFLLLESTKKYRISFATLFRLFIKYKLHKIKYYVLYFENQYILILREEYIRYKKGRTSVNIP